MAHPDWQTPAGSLGTYPQLIPMQIQLEALPHLPATVVFYKIISGKLPPGLNLTTNVIQYVPIRSSTFVNGCASVKT